MWFEERKGDGEPLRPGGDGRYAHWDAFFHSKSTLTDWKVEGKTVSATLDRRIGPARPLRRLLLPPGEGGAKRRMRGATLA
jgi:hypothetical protein